MTDPTEQTVDAPTADASVVTEAAAGEAGPPGILTEAMLEALLFVAERPLPRREIAALAGVERTVVDERLGDLETALADRGIRLVVNGERVELATAPEAGRLIARYVGADAVRLSPAALETLAIVAYRQPVTRALIERIRGVDSEYSVRTLLHRRLIVELGRSEAPGRPTLFGTGFEFLEGIPGTIGGALGTALKEEGHRDAAILTFLVCLSGVSALGIGAAFWGVVAGGVATAVSRLRRAQP